MKFAWLKTVVKNRKVQLMLKLLVLALTLWYVVSEIKNKGGFEKLLSDFSGFSLPQRILLLIACLLVFINWGIEAVKWKKLISKLQPVSLMNSFKAVLSGITINNFIPNRSADFLGRIIYLKAENRAKGTVSTMAGSLSQLMATFTFGILGTSVWLAGNDPFLKYELLPPAIILALVFLFLYFRLPKLAEMRCLDRFKEYLSVLKKYSSGELACLLQLSLFRYLVFALQYFLLLWAFSVNVSPFEGFCGISAIFLFQAFLPSVILTEIGVRGATVLFVFGNSGLPVAGLLGAAYSLWLLNILLPSLAGAIFIMMLKRSNA